MTEQAVLTRSIHPSPLHTEWKKGVYEFGTDLTLYCNTNDTLQLDMMQEVWNNFTMGMSVLHVERLDAMPDSCAVISHVKPSATPPIPKDLEYTVDVTENGFALAASDPLGLTHAFFTTLQLFNPRSLDEGDVRFTAPFCQIEDRPETNFRGIHLCVFPETTLLLLEKAIKLAGYMKFTHVILEFWGTLQFDVMPDLYWKDRSYSKDEVRPLVDMARSMGMQVIPMFNHLGHATASRNMYGRHVVLNQNPKHALLFEPDGWTWCLSNPKTRELLKAIREELIELCGPGDYFCIGCDEAYSFATCDLCSQQDASAQLAQFINDISDEMKDRGRRVIMWGDALLRKGEWDQPYTATGDLEADALPLLSRDVIIADWQYRVNDSKVETAKYFMDQGFDTLLCPWHRVDNILGLADGAKDLNAYGVLATTWHHLPQYMRLIPTTGAAMWQETFTPLPLSSTSPMVRKLVLTDTYEDSGWNAREVDY